MTTERNERIIPFARNRTLHLLLTRQTQYHYARKGTLCRHERDQSFLVPVPAERSFRSRFRSLQKKILVSVPVKNILVTVPVQKKTFWSRSCSEKILMLVLVKKNFGLGPGAVPVPVKRRNLVPVPVKKRNLVPVPVPGPLCSSLTLCL